MSTWILDVDVDEDGAQIAEGNRTDLCETIQHDAGIVEARSSRDPARDLKIRNHRLIC